MAPEDDALLDRLLALRQHRQSGQRSPHKPLLVLLALGQYAATGSSELRWSVVEERLARLIQDYGPPSTTSARQAAAYPFTRLRADGVWALDHDVPMDRIGPLTEHDVLGRLVPELENTLRAPAVLAATARALVDAEFPPGLAADVLVDVGLDPDWLSTTAGAVAADARGSGAGARRRGGTWPSRVLLAWDRQCAFCGFDGQLGHGSVGLEAAHVRWFTHGGPDDLDNGLALCGLHHKLLDRGALGLTRDLTLKVSPHFTARTAAGRLVYELHDRPLQPRPGTPLPAESHIAWHDREVFKAPPRRERDLTSRGVVIRQ